MSLVSFLIFSPSVSAQDVPCQATSTVCGQPSYDSCLPVCLGNSAAYNCYQKNNPNCTGTIYCSSEDSRCLKPTPTPQSNESSLPTCKPTGSVCGQIAYDTCSPICTTDNKAAYDCYQKNNPNCKGTILCSPEDSRCTQAPKPTPIITSSPSPTPVSIPTAKPTPVVTPSKTVTAITVNDQNLTPQVGSELKIKLSIDDPAKDQDVPVRILVTYSDATSKFFFINFHYKPKQITGNELLVDIFVDKNFPNPQKVLDWTKDTIDSYMNGVFTKSGIRKSLRADRMLITDINPKCAQGEGVPPVDPTQKDKIRVFISKNDDYIGLSGRAYPQDLATCMGRRNDNFDQIDPPTLTHEFGHLLGLPDYYLQIVLSQNLHPASHLAIVPPFTDIMSVESSNVDYFHPISRDLVNSVQSLPVDVFNYWRTFTPKEVLFQLLSDQGAPLPQLKVEVFPQVFEVYDNRLFGNIPDIVSFSGMTDNNGRISLGDEKNIFQHRSVSSITRGNSALIRVIYQDQVRFTALTVSYLNHLYFQGNKDSAIISIPFLSLIENKPSPYAQYIPIPGTKSEILDAARAAEAKKILQQSLGSSLSSFTETVPLPSAINSPSPSPTPSSTKSPFDLTNDGAVNAFDASKFIQLWKSGDCSSIDFDKNKICNSLDYATLKQNF